ncbi:bifunctional 4-hydroxy-2-oxoglutarate aldolase/2-dehydro-3-deoxy-phosphogluconate aldolase [Microbacterium sp. USTB-Y]|uniref:bifunctional 4-hydroxy-2-oxoglutarate aldolase/2-dehydro-3-deoxy-phosphogluconate aldolase n=1 Tax=Microbacterium sp. USTB-Y TaxID=2823692 RepID=UPI00203B53AE|nr:bifunctional 4-hydroxy-2-oxoglutarate aldolase/2-dehydro-3-deoxy-phosphogluconate aldolase [Microbacterium sp. USTB-Y]
MDVLEQVTEISVIPVVEIEDADSAVPLARALASGGIRTMEITLRTDAALEAMRRVSGEVEGFLVGAGSIVSPEQIPIAVAAGAAYGVSPGWRPRLSDAAAESALPYVPGVVTPSEVLDAAAHGHRRLKFFPAGNYGGGATLRSFAGPFSSLGVAFMPTGGVTPANLSEFLSLPNVFAVGGTWIAPRPAISAGDFTTIARTAAEAARIAADRS